MTYLPQRGIKLMNHHIQLMISCKGYNCIIASKCTRLCQTGHCMKIGEKNEVFIMEKSKHKHALVYFQFQIMRNKGVHLKSPLALSVQEFSCLSSTGCYSEGHQSFIKDTFTYSFNKYLLKASYKPKSIRDTGNVILNAVIIIAALMNTYVSSTVLLTSHRLSLFHLRTKHQSN